MAKVDAEKQSLLPSQGDGGLNFLSPARQVRSDSNISMKTVDADGDESSPSMKGEVAQYSNPDFPLEEEKKCCAGGLLPHGSIAASGFNLASATLGAGTLAIPSAMAMSGALMGSILLLICCTATVYSIRLLIVVVEKTGYTTYEEISRKVLGKTWERITAFLIVVFCWGITLVYLVAMGDILESLHNIHDFPDCFKGPWGKRLMTVIFWSIVMLPLSLTKEINSLRYASLVGMLATAFLVCAIITHASQEPDRADRWKVNLELANWSFTLLAAIPTFSFSFCCQTNCFEIYAELHEPSVGKMTLTAALSMYACTAIYIIAGVFGMADFGQNVSSNILKNYGDPVKTVYIGCAVVAISFTLTMAYPICIFPTRDSVLQMLGYKDVYTCPTRVRLVIAFALAVLSLIVGLFVPNIGVLFGILGGVCGSSLGYIYPAVFVLKTCDWKPQTVGWANVIGTWVLLIAGGISGILGTILSIYSTATSGGS